MRLLYEARPDIALAREVESICHAVSQNSGEYLDHVRRAAFNLRENKEVTTDVVLVPDEVLSRNTLSGRIQEETKLRRERFEKMLQDKYDSLNDKSFEAIVKCRRCGSSEVSWDEKQTRSADEGATVFCMCLTCKNRWVMR
jgi:DNA-directed RNA polymerase subunit M/transcription elongation factor TFIIS